MRTWRKSSRSNDPAIAACVEVASLDDGIGLRDSKLVREGRYVGRVLNVSSSAFEGLVNDIKNGRYAL